MGDYVGIMFPFSLANPTPYIPIPKTYTLNPKVRLGLPQSSDTSSEADQLRRLDKPELSQWGLCSMLFGCYMGVI